MTEAPLAPRAQCAICMTAVEGGEPVTACPACRAPYHAECWSENGGCAIYGCKLVPKTENLKPLEIPPAYWGRDDKDCPRCGSRIAAMAVRCRHCGTAFSSARPEGRAAFSARVEREARAPMFKQIGIGMLIAALVPLLSFFVAVAGPLYFHSNREEIRKVRGGAEGFYKIAIGVAIVHSAIVLIALFAYMVKTALS